MPVPRHHVDGRVKPGHDGGMVTPDGESRKPGSPRTGERLPPLDLLAALTVVTLWGLNFVAGKEAVAALPPFLVSTIRFVAVGLLLAPFCRPRRDQLPALAVVAMVLGVGHFGLLFYALKDLDAGSAAVAIQLGVPFSVLLAWMVFRDRPGGRRLAGIALAFSGVALLAGDPGRPSLGPLLLVVVSISFWSVANILVKRLGEISPLVLNGWVSLLAAPVMLALTLTFEHGQAAAMAAAGWQAWAGVAFTILFSSIVAYSLWYRLLGRHPVSRVVPFSLLGPVVGFLGGVVVLGEALTVYKVVGGLLTVAGVAVIELLPGPSPVAAGEPEPAA
jgi:O-acetylserine/cysteine efflux transporter